MLLFEQKENLAMNNIMYSLMKWLALTTGTSFEAGCNVVCLYSYPLLE